MSIQLSLSLEFRPTLCLALAIGNRELGVALATREHLLRAYVVTLRKLPEDERPARAILVLSRLVADYRPHRIALVTVPAAAAEPVATAVRACLFGASHTVEGTEPPPAVTPYDADQVRRGLVPADVRPTNRALARHLGNRFPSLARRVPRLAVAADGEALAGRVPQRTNRERYVVRLFLAVAGAVHDLDQELFQRLTLTSPPVCAASA